MVRIIQYIRRFTNIYLGTWPGQYQQRKISILEEILRESVKFMDQVGEEYWIDFGTLLGYYREGGIIPHDIDIDFAVHEKSFKNVLMHRNKVPQGFIFYDTSKNHHGPKCYLSYKGFDIDIYCYEDLGDTLRSYEKTKFPNERQEIPKKMIYPLKNTMLLGVQVHVPNKTESYLKHIYGSINRTAKRDMISGFWKD